jgi:hypothetical protein
MLMGQPVSYPSSDEVNYLEWFGPAYSSVFIALNPFIRLTGGLQSSDGDWTPEEVLRAAKSIGQPCGVTWADMALCCDLGSIVHLNQALGKTGSRRLDAKYASQERTERLLEYCKSASIYPPDEGYPSPLFELSMGAFLNALGHEEAILGDGFGGSMKRIASTQLLDPQQITEFREIRTHDGSLYVTIYTDYHYYLIAQTEKSLQSSRPDQFFEGFYADGSTNDFWGIPDLPKV